MHFSIIHETVGSRGRLRVRATNAFSQRGAHKLLDTLFVIEGLEDIVINMRVGSIVAFYTSIAARQAMLETLGIVHALTPTAVTFIEDKLKRGAEKETTTGSSFLAKQGNSLFSMGLNYICRFVVLRFLLPWPVRVLNAVRSAWPYLSNGFVTLIQGKLNVDVLDATAILVSILRRDFRTVRVLTLLLGFGELLEKWTRQTSRDSLAQSLALDIDLVWVRREGEEMRVQLDAVQKDDFVIVRAGAAIAVDGVVEEGEAVVNQSSMTGEPLGIVRTVGASVYAGTVVEEGELYIRPTGIGSDTRLQKIIAFIEDSQSRKAEVESRALRLADMAVPFTFALAGLVWLITRNPLRAASVLLVDYSCALRLATPLAILSALREGAKNGILIKGGTYLEALAEADTIVFDKTGTLTESRPVVAEVIPGEGYSREEVLRIAACLEEHFPHPVARAVVRQAEEENLSHREEHTKVEYVVAHGIASSLHGKRVLLGSRHYIEQDEHVDVSPMEEHVARLSECGMSLLYLAMDKKLVGLIAMEDCLRPEASAVIEALRTYGIKRVVMLTGDDVRTATAVAKHLGLSEFYAGVLPIEKADVIRKLQGEGCKVIMVGDGINDAPALSAAEVSISLRDGADLAREVADVVLLDCTLDKLVTARRLSQEVLRRIHRNFVVNMSFNSAFLAGGLLGVLSPQVTAVLHNATTVGVTVNAMRPMLEERPTP